VTARQGTGTVLTMSADALSLRRLTQWLADVLAATGSESTVLQARVELAVHEICMNVVDHAYGTEDGAERGDIAVEAAVDADAVRIWVTDCGGRFDPETAPPPVPGRPQVRGYGLVIAGKLTDDLGYRRETGRNTWTLRFDRTHDKQEAGP